MSIEHSFTQQLQDSERRIDKMKNEYSIKMREFEETSSKIREIIQWHTVPITTLRKAMMVSAEEFTSWIYELREKHKDWYMKLEDELVFGIEINGVFRKPGENGFEV